MRVLWLAARTVGAVTGLVFVDATAAAAVSRDTTDCSFGGPNPPPVRCSLSLPRALRRQILLLLLLLLLLLPLLLLLLLLLLLQLLLVLVLLLLLLLMLLLLLLLLLLLQLQLLLLLLLLPSFRLVAKPGCWEIRVRHLSLNISILFHK